MKVFVFTDFLSACCLVFGVCVFTGTEAEVEVDEVTEVTKQLEKQVVEDKEKEEEGEEGD